MISWVEYAAEKGMMEFANILDPQATNFTHESTQIRLSANFADSSKAGLATCLTSNMRV